MSREITPFALRMPQELRQKIEQAAKESKRSLNAEILDRLERSFATDRELERFEAKIDEASAELLIRTSDVLKALAEKAQKDKGKRGK